MEMKELTLPPSGWVSVIRLAEATPPRVLVAVYDSMTSFTLRLDPSQAREFACLLLEAATEPIEVELAPTNGAWAKADG